MERFSWFALLAIYYIYIYIQKSHYLFVSTRRSHPNHNHQVRDGIYAPYIETQSFWVLCKTYVSLKIITKWLGGGLFRFVWINARPLWATDRASSAGDDRLWAIGSRLAGLYSSSRRRCASLPPSLSSGIRVR